jgi:hypothetical protein
MIKRITSPAILAGAFTASGLLIVLLTAHAESIGVANRKPVSAVPSPAPAKVRPQPAAAAAAVVQVAVPQSVVMLTAKAGVFNIQCNPGVLDQRRQYALGMIETGNHDARIGGAGEVSRYQILPSVWRRYSDSESYQNPDVSLAVAQQYWTTLYSGFKGRAHREPTDFDMYVLWNTHWGYYASRNFDPALIAPVVRDRAQRYRNLVAAGQAG